MMNILDNYIKIIIYIVKLYNLDVKNHILHDIPVIIAYKNGNLEMTKYLYSLGINSNNLLATCYANKLLSNGYIK